MEYGQLQTYKFVKLTVVVNPQQQQADLAGQPVVVVGGSKLLNFYLDI